jgi:hypothetical protein
MPKSKDKSIFRLYGVPSDRLRCFVFRGCRRGHNLNETMKMEPHVSFAGGRQSCAPQRNRKAGIKVLSTQILPFRRPQKSIRGTKRTGARLAAVPAAPPACDEDIRTATPGCQSLSFSQSHCSSSPGQGYSPRIVRRGHH